MTELCVTAYCPQLVAQYTTTRLTTIDDQDSTLHKTYITPRLGSSANIFSYVVSSKSMASRRLSLTL